MKTIAFILLSAIGMLAAAGTIDPKTPDSKHVAYADGFVYVARFACREVESGRKAYASCVVISPHWVITAAHVVHESKDCEVILGGKAFPLAEVIVHPKFRHESLGGDDLALGRSEKDFGLEFYPALYGQGDEVGKVVSLCGYGLTGTFATGHTVSDSRRRAGSNTIDSVDTRGALICSAGIGKATELEFLIAPGDSGGGLFIGNELAGINAFVMSDRRSPMSRSGDESGHTRISTHREWINEHVK